MCCSSTANSELSLPCRMLRGASVLQGDLLLGRNRQGCLFTLAALVGSMCGFLGGKVSSFSSPLLTASDLSCRPQGCRGLI